MNAQNKNNPNHADCSGSGMRSSEPRLSLFEGLKIWPLLGLRSLYKFYTWVVIVGGLRGL
jgi:hypothetical protein